MPPASNEEQFKFLISCIRYSNNGKVDFGQVAHECKIVSKGAAAKRYERMMRSHGIAPNAATVKPALSRTLKVERSTETQSSEPPKKRNKTDAFRDDSTVDDDEVFGSGIKSEIGDQFVVKEEEESDMTLAMRQKNLLPDAMGSGLDFGEAANLLQYYNPDPSSVGYSTTRLGYDDGYNNAGGDFGMQTPRGSEFSAPGFDLSPTQQQFDFSSSYQGAGMGSLSIVDAENTQYHQPMLQYPIDDRGNSAGSFIVK